MKKRFKSFATICDESCLIITIKTLKSIYNFKSNE